MLEFFAVTSFSDKARKNKNKENKKINELFNTPDVPLKVDSTINFDALNFVLGIVALVVSILTAKLAYQCNIKRDQASQVVATLFGFFFSGTYLLYYFIWHFLLKNKCH